MRTSVIAVAVAAAASSVAAGGEAVVAAENLQPGMIYSVAADGSGRVNLSRDPARDEQPAVSPDGARIAFVSHRDGYDAVYVMNADGGDQRQLVGRVADNYKISGLTWSPTGGTLAFSADSRGGIFCSPSSIYAVDVADRGVRQLTRDGFDWGPTFSHDGRFVAYQSCGGYVGVARVDLGRGGLVGVADPEQWPSWAPHGQRLLLLRRRGNHDVRYLTTIDPAGQTRWVLRGVAATAPAWSPSGRLIAFFRPFARRPGLYVVRPGTQRLRRLVTVYDEGSSIAWSPNGAWLAFSADGRTYFVRSSGRGLRRVAAAQSPLAWSPPLVWSRDSRRFAFVDRDGAARVVNPPDTSALAVTEDALDAEVSGIAWAAGDRLVFATSNRRSRHLFAVEPDGTGMRQVAPDGAPVGELSADGSRVAFVRDAQIRTARLDGSDQRRGRLEN